MSAKNGAAREIRVVLASGREVVFVRAGQYWHDTSEPGVTFGSAELCARLDHMCRGSR